MKAQRALCVLTAVLFGILSMAFGEGAPDPAEVPCDPAGNAAAVDVVSPDAGDPAEAALPRIGDDDEPSDDPLPAPAEETEFVPDVPPEEDAEPADEPASDPAPSPDDGPELPEIPVEEPADAPADEPIRWDGVLQVGAACEMTVRGEALYRLTLARDADLLLEVGGLPVRVTVTALRSGWTRQWQSAAADASPDFVIHAPVSLEKGDYSVTVAPLAEDYRDGTVSLCFSSAETAADGLTDAAPADDSPADAPALTPAESAETEAQAEEALSVKAPAAAAAEAPEAPAEALPTVRILFSCDGPCRPGATVTLTAAVSGPDDGGTIRWQYSTDGGETVHEAEGAEGLVYSFILDEVNCTYWWRAYLE